MSASSRRNSDTNDEEEEWKSDLEEEESASADSDYSEGNSDSDIDDQDDEIPFRRTGGRSILWLCQEGQLQLARKRFEWLVQQQRKEEEEEQQQQQQQQPQHASSTAATTSSFQQQLFKEVFQVGQDKNYALHEILMGGTSDTNAYQLACHIMDYAFGGQEETREDHVTLGHTDPLLHRTARDRAATKMLAARPPSHQRTALHWAAWGNATCNWMICPPRSSGFARRWR